MVGLRIAQEQRIQVERDVGRSNILSITSKVKVTYIEVKLVGWSRSDMYGKIVSATVQEHSKAKQR